MIFVDWLTINQLHRQGAKCLNGGQFMEINPDGSLEYRIDKFHMHKGSFATSLALRSSVGRVELSGNVGRFGRSDNLFNSGWDDTLKSAQAVLSAFDLPLFTSGATYSDSRGNTQSFGASVTRLDLTRNYSTGSPQHAVAFLSWLDGQSLAYIRRGRKVGSTTVEWGSNKGRYKLIAYDKAQEMLDHSGDKEVMENDRVYQYCRDNGIVRVELKLKRQELADKGLRFLGDIDMGKLIQIYNEKTDFVKGAEVVCSDLDLSDLSSAVRCTYEAYMRGADVSQWLSNGTLYRHAKILRAYGVDITSNPSVQRLKTEVRTINLVPTEKPDWYSLKAA
jgi:hypothetical protein